MAQKSESRLRAQVITPRSSRRLKKARPRRTSDLSVGKILSSAAAFAKPAAIIVAITLVIWGYNAVANSALFEIRRIDVVSANTMLQSEVEQTIRRAIGQKKLLDVDIAAIRQKIEAIPRVRAALVSRVLPDSLYVRVTERQAAVLVRRESKAIIWLDDDAVEIGDVSELKQGEGQQVPPIAKGFSEGNRTQSAMAEDRERIALYKQIKKEFSEASPPVWDLVDEIDLAFIKDVNLRLANPSVTIHLGGKDFRNRFETALKVLASIRQGDSDMLSRYRVRDADRLIQNAQYINFIDAARPDRIVINFSTPGTEKPIQQENKSNERRAKQDARQ